MAGPDVTKILGNAADVAAERLKKGVAGEARTAIKGGLNELTGGVLGTPAPGTEAAAGARVTRQRGAQASVEAEGPHETPGFVEAFSNKFRKPSGSGADRLKEMFFGRGKAETGVAAGVAATATAATMTAVGATLPEGSYLESGAKGKPPTVVNVGDIEAQANARIEAERQRLAAAAAKPAEGTLASSPLVGATAAAVSDPLKVDVTPLATTPLVAAPAITTSVSAGSQFTQASKPPKAVIFLTSSDYKAAEFDGVRKVDISGSSRFMEAVKALDGGKKLSPYQEKALDDLAREVGADNRAELQSMIQKPKGAEASAAASGLSASGIDSATRASAIGLSASGIDSATRAAAMAEIQRRVDEGKIKPSQPSPAGM